MKHTHPNHYSYLYNANKGYLTSPLFARHCPNEGIIVYHIINADIYKTKGLQH